MAIHVHLIGLNAPLKNHLLALEFDIFVPFLDQGRRSIFRIGGGGQRCSIKFAREARRKIENCVCLAVFLCKISWFCSALYTMLFKPILALHMKFSSCRNYGGGGGQNDMFAPRPQYFHWGRLPPPPQDRRLCSGSSYLCCRKRISPIEKSGLALKTTKFCGGHVLMVLETISHRQFDHQIRYETKSCMVSIFKIIQHRFIHVLHSHCFWASRKFKVMSEGFVMLKNIEDFTERALIYRGAKSKRFPLVA